MTQPQIYQAQDKKGNSVQVYDVSALLNSKDPALVQIGEQLFRKSQRVYHANFPECEKEPTAVVRGYIDECGNPQSDEGRFVYVVAAHGERAQGMASGGLLPTEDKDLVVFGNYIVTRASERQTGLASILLRGMLNSAQTYAAEQGLTPLAVFGEVEQPHLPNAKGKYQDQVRDYVRPRAHHKMGGLGALVVLNEEGIAEVVPHAMPGVGHGEPATPLLPAVTMLSKDCELEKLITPIGTVEAVGGRIRELPESLVLRIDPKTAYNIHSAIMEDYASTPEVYSLRQVGNIARNAERVLQDHADVFIVPILDTRILEVAKAKKRN